MEIEELTDEELVKSIKKAIRDLNIFISAATMRGIQVEIDSYPIATMGDSTENKYYTVVARKEI